MSVWGRLMKVLKHWGSVVESAIEKAMRKLIILSFEEPAGPCSGPVHHATALAPSGPFLQDFWSTPLKKVMAWHGRSTACLVTTPQYIFIIQNMSTLLCFENCTEKYWSYISYCCCEIQKWSDMWIMCWIMCSAWAHVLNNRHCWAPRWPSHCTHSHAEGKEDLNMQLKSCSASTKGCRWVALTRVRTFLLLEYSL